MCRTCRPLLCVVVAVALFSLTGCNGGQEVSGKVVFPQQITLQPDDLVSIVFDPEDAGGKPGSGRVTVDDKSFIARSADGKGILPGKYTIGLMIIPYAGHPDYKKRVKALESFNNQYGTTPTKLTYEVTSDGPQSITVDLVRSTVTRN
jgi:hypothetical protein